ncbi:MAG: S1C family serine protease [Ktedonobacterales bacterium]
MSVHITEPSTGQSEPAVQGAPSQQPEVLPWSTWNGGEPIQPQSPYIGGEGTPPYFPGSRFGGPRRRRWRAVFLALALLVALAIGVAVGSIFSAARTASSGTIQIGASTAPNISTSGSTLSLQQSLEKTASAVEPSVVKITSVSGQGEAVGSGDILTSNGYIVTNDHVVAGYTSFTVKLPSGATYAATVIGQDAQDDLAVIKIAATNLKPIAFADSSKAQVGEFAVAIGYPLALQETATYGIVSAVNQAVSEAPSGPAGELPGLIQTSAQLNPGNSGGALVNISGQLIGIPTLSATNSETGSSANGIGYAISSDRVEYVASQLIQNGKVTSSDQGFLGIEGQDVTPQVAAAYGLSAQSGVLVSGFASDTAGQSPAQQSGLQSGDIITAVNGQAVTDSNDLAAATMGSLPGTKVTLTILRGSSQMSISVTLGERPVS